MDLLGSPSNQLSTFHYQELLALLESSVAKGDYGGGALIDSSAIAALNTQSQNFSLLPSVSAGQLALAESINNPINLMNAIYQAIRQESTSFVKKLSAQLKLLEKESGLIDFLLGAAELDSWVQKQPQLSDATLFSGNLETSLGEIPTSVPYTDPAHSDFSYVPSKNGIFQMVLVTQPVLGGPTKKYSGITVPSAVTTTQVNGFEWSYSPSGKDETLFGSDWAELTLLEPQQQFVFGTPQVTQILPQTVDSNSSWNNFLSVSLGDSPVNVNVYVQIVMIPRRRQVTVTLSGPTFLSSGLLLDNLIVYDDQGSYQDGTDYTIDGNGNLVPVTLTGKTVNVFLTENFPAYICSVNQQIWSSPVMLDPLRLYPDTASVFPPVFVQGTSFPITDELGFYLGMRLQVNSLPTQEYMIRVSPTVSTVGASAQLMVDFDRPSFMNGLQFAPVTNYPCYLQSIQVEGLTPNTLQTIFSSGSTPLLVDKLMSIRFPRALIRKAYFTLSQVNYTLKQHVLDPVDKNYRDAMVSLQSVLPFSAQEIQPGASNTITGAQYEFGLRKIAGQNWTTQTSSTNPGVFITGPFTVNAQPEMVRLDIEFFQPDSSGVSVYLLSQEKDTNGTIQSIVTTAITPGTAIAYSPVSSNIDTVDFYLKFILREEYTLVHKYLLQVATI